MKKISTVRIFKSEIFKEQKLTIGVDLGDLWSFYCVRDEAVEAVQRTGRQFLLVDEGPDLRVEI